jgi:hypothetical protein
VHEPAEGLDGDALNLNSGVVVLQRGLDDAVSLGQWCLEFFREHAVQLRYPDQAARNALAAHGRQPLWRPRGQCGIRRARGLLSFAGPL